MFGPRLLPDRLPSAEQQLARPTGSDLEDIYKLGEQLWEIRVSPASPFIGQTLAQINLGERLGVAVVAVWHGRQAIFTPTPRQQIHRDDMLLIVGREERVSQLTQQDVTIGRNGRMAMSARVGFHSSR